MEQMTTSLLLSKIEGQLPEDITLTIAITGDKVTRSTGQRHTGFVVQGHDRKLWLFDFAWHKCVRKCELVRSYAFPPDIFIDEYAAAAITAFLVLNHSRSPNEIKYSIGWNEHNYFDNESDAYIAKEHGDGLTCATFVLEVLKHHGFDMIATQTWPVTEEDKNWQKGKLKQLKEDEFPPTKEDFEIQSSLIGLAPRFRPEQVIAAATLYDESPLEYLAVSPVSDQIVRDLVSLDLDTADSSTACA